MSVSSEARQRQEEPAQAGEASFILVPPYPPCKRAVNHRR
jgi:hypothetical protein